MRKIDREYCSNLEKLQIRLKGKLHQILDIGKWVLEAGFQIQQRSHLNPLMLLISLQELFVEHVLRVILAHILQTRKLLSRTDGIQS
jgi:hypothetical protein